MHFAYLNSYGSSWLEHIATSDKRDDWRCRAEEERRRRRTRGTLVIPDEGLAYANFYDLVKIANKHWQPLAPALGKKAELLPLLRRFDSLRNTVGHSRPLLLFEQDLLSGIAGQIRNQVTIFMSEQDPVGNIYSRIETITDTFGRRIESSVVEGELAGVEQTYNVILRPGDIVTYNCRGIDPQDRDLHWQLKANHNAVDHVTAQSGHDTVLTWHIGDRDVTESAVVEIYLSNAGRYQRFSYFDHRAYFKYAVRPPVDEQP